jgi:hypothetical protein
MTIGFHDGKVADVRRYMEAAAAGALFIGLIGFIVGVFVIVEFLLVGHRVYKIWQILEQQCVQLDQQTRYLAAISTSLVRGAVAPASSRPDPAPANQSRTA